MIGKTLAHYEITALLGKGGMGEVYRAHDGKLGREVALKLLPADVARDPERLARFQREARTLASLNHPNIAGLHGVERDGEHRFLVMELVEGADLAERLRHGPLSLDEVLDAARQIAEGLEEAHEKGIVHRDLKPANIKLTPEGRVKILDFGLARAFGGEAVDEGDLLNSPTITAAMTQAGVILGTAAYMSPEQAKGRAVDRRADMWAFGVILWEMLTGNRLFAGEDTSDTLAAVLRQDPPWGALPAETPAEVRRLLERCLERDARKRLRDIGEARVRLERWRDDPTSLHGAAPAAKRPARLGSTFGLRLSWVLTALAIAVAIWGWWPQSSAPVSDRLSLTVGLRLPHADQLDGNFGSAVLVSPTSEHLLYRAGSSLYLHRLQDGATSELSGTEGATVRTFSPDGRWIAFTAGGVLKRVSVTGGAPIDICDAPDSRGVAWLDEQTLVFAPSFTGGLSAVSLSDGVVRPLSTIDEDAGERSHRWPQRLPDGRSVLFMCQYAGRDYDESDIQVVSLESGERRTVYRGGSYPHYVSTGHLLFVRDDTVFGLPLDLASGRTQGLAVPIIETIWALAGDQEADDGSAQFDASPAGVLIYRRAGHGQDQTRLAFLDLETGETSSFGDPAVHESVSMSPDEQWLAVVRGVGGQREIYLVDLETQVDIRFTVGQGADFAPVWSRDSKIVYWTRAPGDGSYRIMRKPADGSRSEEELYRAIGTLVPGDVSPDGRYLTLTEWARADEYDVTLLRLDEPGSPSETLIGGDRGQVWGRFSPDGKWLSYFSDETGQWHGYLRRFPDTGARWQITREDQGFGDMHWMGTAEALILRTPTQFVRVPLDFSGESVRLGRPQPMVSDDSIRSPSYWTSAITQDASRAVVFRLVEGQQPDEPSRAGELVLVTGFNERLSRMVPIED